MISPNYRAALFIDLENLYTTLKNLNKQGQGDYGASPSIDFAALADYINRNIGTLTKEDTFAAANFSHYNRQWGGLNQYANLIEVDSFLPSTLADSKKTPDGKKFVVHNYSDMALAYHIGRHASRNPANIYVFITGDGAFTAVADQLVQSGRQVQFILPDPDSASYILKERFLCIPFNETQPEPAPSRPAQPAASLKKKAKPYRKAVQIVKDLRREFSTAIPQSLVKAAIGPSSADRILNHARSEEVLDLWQSENGIDCVSLAQERLYGKVQVMEPRPVFARAANVLFAVALLAESDTPPLARADWRRSLKTSLETSSASAKQWLQLLLDCGILLDSQIGQPDLSLTKLKHFMQQAEKKYSA